MKRRIATMVSCKDQYAMTDIYCRYRWYVKEKTNMNKILIVDDEREVIAELERLLSNYGCVSTVAGDADRKSVV